MSLDYLSEVYADLDERIDNIRTLADVNEELISIAINNLQSIRKDLAATGRNLGILSKIDNQLLMYQQVARIPQLTTKFPIIREQSVVLMVGALEVFVADVFRAIGNNDPKLFVWKDPKEKILVEPSLISDEFTLGDAIINHLKTRGFSFQDLQSLIRAFETYFDIKIDLNKAQLDILIAGTAYRNVIVHNRSVIDTQFLKQIRDTSHITDLSQKKGEKIQIDDKFVRELALSIKELCEKVIALLMEEVES